MAHPGDIVVASAARKNPSEVCSRLFVRARESPWGLKAAMVVFHVFFAGVLFLLDRDLIRRTKEKPWCTGTYLVIFGATLAQYFFTSGSSPGYVIDAMRAANGMKAIFIESPTVLKSLSSGINQQVLSYALALCYTWDSGIAGHELSQKPVRTGLARTVTLYRWYIFEETILCIWTVILYITFLHSKDTKAWWKDFILIVLLVPLAFCVIFLILLLLFHSYLALTNQTTYETVKRQRILYLRGIPAGVHPFSNGIFRNLRAFCCSRVSIYDMEAVPPMEELEDRARPYTCVDVVSCRCC
ncbi:DHHC palmitoyltransferase [Musa troglodytarum]|uniref:protein S-acyltransferase n=1 Tax=Musa troglodytarum TaxID=320322 RepID=A0A9E7G1Z5_9LILI|nr:DHHC palmitoyltransferase [Musa troglodytarum]